MKLIIAGSRDIYYPDTVSKIVKIIEKHFKITHIISGCATGVDKSGEKFAIDHGKELIKMPADWNTHGKAAGPIRNEEMLKLCDIVLVIIRGDSKGSTHMLNIAKRDKKRIIHFNFDTKDIKTFNIQKEISKELSDAISKIIKNN